MAANHTGATNPAGYRSHDGYAAREFSLQCTSSESADQISTRASGYAEDSIPTGRVALFFYMAEIKTSDGWQQIAASDANADVSATEVDGVYPFVNHQGGIFHRRMSVGVHPEAGTHIYRMVLFVQIRLNGAQLTRWVVPPGGHGRHTCSITH